MRLEWWREAIATAFEDGPARRHEVIAPLREAIGRWRLSRGHLDRLIDGREADFEEEPPASLAALEAYAEATSAPLMRLALEVLGVADADAEAAAQHVAIAYALAGLLRALPFQRGRRRPVIPADIAARHGLDPRGCAAGRGSPGLRAAVAEIAEAAEGRLRAARAGGPTPRAALPALLWAVVAARALRRLRRGGCDPFDPSLALPDPTQAWRLALAALLNRY
jgi:phytoene synthase